jgi:hypothetical protein
LQSILALATSPTDSLVHTTQLDIQIGTKGLEPDADLLEALDLLAFHVGDLLFGHALVAEDVAVASDHDEVALVVDCDDLAALDLGLGWVEGVEGFADEETEGGAEVV